MTDLSAMLAAQSEDQILISTLHRRLYNPDFAGFDVPVEAWTPKPYDGWFHPSSQSQYTLRQLYLYRTRPDLLTGERMPLTGVLAVTAGKFWHAFVQMVLLDDGVLVQAEVPVLDEYTHRRGHADGMLANGDCLEIKCMVPSTMLEMADGTRRAAVEIRVGDMVIGWDEAESRTCPMAVVDCWDNGVRETVTITTYEGKTLTVTMNHPILTQRGWVAAREVMPKDRVGVADVPQWVAEMKCLDPEEAHALGVLVGDGGLTGQVMYLTSADLDVVDRMQTYARNHGAELVKGTSKYVYRFRVPRQQARTIGNPILNRLREEGLAGCSSHTKRVPPSVWRGGPEAWAQFLSGYLDADGTIVTTRTGSYPHLSWGSVNRDLLLDCQVLLIRLGIRSSVVSHVGQYKGEPHQSWYLMVRDRASVAMCQQLLDLWCEHKRDDLASLMSGSAKVGHVLTAQVGWDRVRSVQPAGEQSTIGIQVDGGTHLTNGIVTHNTINDFQVEKINCEEVLKEKKPGHWCQTQDYLDCLGLRSMRYLIIAPTYPFRMSEFLVRADFDYIAKRRVEYRRAYELSLDYPDGSLADDLAFDVLPACCAPKSTKAKSCFAALSCPIGRFQG